MISISLAYIINYAINDKYTYEQKKINNATNNEIPISSYHETSPMNKLNDYEELNPLVDFIMGITKGYRIYDKTSKKYLEEYYFVDSVLSFYKITKRVSELEIEYRFICGNDSNCSSANESSGVFFWLLYTGFKLDHQADIPFQIDKDEPNLFPEPFEFGRNQKGVSLEFDWEVIKYKDQKSIFDSLTNNQKETIYGYLKPETKTTYTVMTPKNDYIKYYYDKNWNKVYYMNFLTVKVNNRHFEYLLFERKKVEFLDILANIGALFSTIKFFFCLVFNFYSKNFDNYKILGKTLNSKKDPFKKIQLNLNINDSNNQSMNKKKNNQMNDIEKKIH